ncbi:hypothetical protein EH171_15095 [Enterovibrio baiacu]|nr:hypothetical protein [Enterovibrio baiacu]
MRRYLTKVSSKREARSEKREARSEKREARSEKREARSEKRIDCHSSPKETRIKKPKPRLRFFCIRLGYYANTIPGSANLTGNVCASSKVAHSQAS